MALVHNYRGFMKTVCPQILMTVELIIIMTDYVTYLICADVRPYMPTTFYPIPAYSSPFVNKGTKSNDSDNEDGITIREEGYTWLHIHIS